MGEVVQIREEHKDGPMVFEGSVIKLRKRHYDLWKRVYHAIPDIDAALASLDAYYASETDPGNWFVRCSTALGNKHQKWKAQQVAEHEPEKRGPRKFTGVANTMPVKCTPEELQAYNTQFHCQADEVPSWWLSQHRRR
jgi:hypothetical protein